MTNHRKNVTDSIVASIAAGTAPWQTSSQPTPADHQFPYAPFNPSSGKHYCGANRIWLQIAARKNEGNTDSRWLTAAQAKSLDAHIRAGEEGTTIEYWHMTTEQPATTSDGTSKKNQAGKIITETVPNPQPTLIHATVFNGAQMDGLEKEYGDFLYSVYRAEGFLEGSGFSIEHDQKDKAFIDPKSETLHLPPMEMFNEREPFAYYATALHLVAQASMTKDYLNTPDDHGLRAAMASVIISGEIGIGLPADFVHRDDEKISAALKDDHNEFFRAARDAHNAVSWVFDHRRWELEVRAQYKKEYSEQELEHRAKYIKEKPTRKFVDLRLKDRHYITIPFDDMNEARVSAGAQWDRTAKAWYVGKDSDLSLIAKWDTPPPKAENQITPLDEFAAFCKKEGLVIDGDPIMDGAWHRVPLEGDNAPNKAGSYKGYLEGKPNGMVQTTKYRTSRITKWVSTGVILNANDQAAYQELWANNKAELAVARAEKGMDVTATHEEAARTANEILENSPNAYPHTCPYLREKEIEAYNVGQLENGTLLIPAHDSKGKLLSVQFVTDESKTFLQDTKTEGSFHTIDYGYGNGPVIITEDYVTAATIYDATRRSTITAFEPNNLEPVVASLKSRNPDLEILIAVNNPYSILPEDRFDLEKRESYSPWFEKALAVAKLFDGKVIPAHHTEEQMEKGASTFNDMLRESGQTAVKEQVEFIIAKHQKNRSRPHPAMSREM